MYLQIRGVTFLLINVTSECVNNFFVVVSTNTSSHSDEPRQHSGGDPGFPVVSDNKEVRSNKDFAKSLRLPLEFLRYESASVLQLTTKGRMSYHPCQKRY